MNNTLKLILSIVGFAAIFAVAAVGYNYLSDKYTPKVPFADNDYSDTESENTDSSDNDAQAVPAVDFTVYDADGNEVTLFEKIGKPIIVNFWATWCGPCKSEMPHFEQAFSKYGQEIEFMMINPTDGVNDTHENVAKFLSETGYTFPVYYDTESDAGVKYGVTGFPMTYFIDSEGNVLGYIPGAMDSDTLYACIDMLRGTPAE